MYDTFVTICHETVVFEVKTSRKPHKHISFWGQLCLSCNRHNKSKKLLFLFVKAQFDDCVEVLVAMQGDLEERVRRLEEQIEQFAAAVSNLPAAVREELANGGNPVRTIRRHRLMTQKELAELSELGENHISNIENGAQFNMRTARRLAKALNVRIDDIA